MEEFDLETPASVRASRPSSAAVLSLLAGIALIFSYLIGYALVNALVAAEIIAPWQPGNDPRMKWFVISFVALTSAFLAIGAIVRSAARRQMCRMEAMEREAESPI